MTHDILKNGTVTRRTLLKGAAAGAAGLAASSLVGPANLTRSVAAQETTTVRLTGFAASDQERPLLQQALDDFAAKNPTIKVEYSPVVSDYNIKLQADIAAGNVADVFYVQGEFSQDFMSRDVLLALDDYMAASGTKVEDFYPGLIQAFQWQGKTYGLPKDWSTLAMIYNQTMFEEAEVTTPPATWDELTTAATKLKDAGMDRPLIVSPSFDRFLPFLYQAGGNVTNPEVTQITLDSPESLEALKFFYGLYESGLAQTFQDAGAQDPQTAFISEAGAVIFDGNWVYPSLAQAPEVTFGISELPAGPKGKGTPAFTVSYSLYKGTQVADAAWTLVNYLTGPEGMATWTSAGLAMPSRPGLAEQWLAKFPERAPYLNSGEYAKTAQYGPGGQKFNEDANAIMQNLFAGGTTPEEAIKELATKAQEDITLNQ